MINIEFAMPTPNDGDKSPEAQDEENVRKMEEDSGSGENGFEPNNAPV